MGSLLPFLLAPSVPPTKPRKIGAVIQKVITRIATQRARPYPIRYVSGRTTQAQTQTERGNELRIDNPTSKQGTELEEEGRGGSPTDLPAKLRELTTPLTSLQLQDAGGTVMGTPVPFMPSG